MKNPGNERIDWSQLWYPGPTRVFTPAELARAGSDKPSRTLAVMVMVNTLMLCFGLLLWAPPPATARLAAMLAGMLLAAWRGGADLWRRPSRRLLTVYTLAFGAACSALLVGIQWRVGDAALMPWYRGGVLAPLLTITLSWWFLTLYRAHQIEGRLRELAERDKAVALAGQLMAAQIQPHFLFNSLASLQHWVHTRDERAAPLLDALTGFLRDTLPLFNRPELTLRDEVPAVQHYLEVMQARLGPRLQFAIDLPPALLPLRLPPGLLLTLVENAVEHGVQPNLAGGTLQIQGRVLAEQAVLEVLDTGAGLLPDQPDGVGLSNSRSRLEQAWGSAASLQLAQRPGGGCCACVTLPLFALHPPQPSP